MMKRENEEIKRDELRVKIYSIMSAAAEGLDQKFQDALLEKAYQFCYGVQKRTGMAYIDRIAETWKNVDACLSKVIRNTLVDVNRSEKRSHVVSLEDIDNGWDEFEKLSAKYPKLTCAGAEEVLLEERSDPDGDLKLLAKLYKKKPASVICAAFRIGRRCVPQKELLKRFQSFETTELAARSLLREAIEILHMNGFDFHPVVEREEVDKIIVSFSSRKLEEAACLVNEFFRKETGKSLRR